MILIECDLCGAAEDRPLNGWQFKKDLGDTYRNVCIEASEWSDFVAVSFRLYRRHFCGEDHARQWIDQALWQPGNELHAAIAAKRKDS